MAEAAPLLARRRLLAAKAEATPGTAEALTAVEAAFNVTDLKIANEFESEERQQPGTFDHNPDQVDTGKGTLSFQMEVTGGSAQPAWAEVFLPACGLGFVATKYIVDELPPQAGASTCHTLTLGCYVDGVKKLLYGAMGNVKFTFPSAKRVLMDFTFSGIWGAPTDVALLAPTLPVLAPLLCKSAACTIGAWSPKFQELTIDLGNEVVVRESANAATGYQSAIIANRRPVGTINPEATLVAGHDLYGAIAASTEAAFAYTAASAADDAAFVATGLQFLKGDEAEREGIVTDEVDFALNNHDLEITFS